MNIQMIPLTALVPSPANVRKTGVKIGIDELAASIAAHGLLQNLQVRPSKDGKYQVIAGGRRLAALKLLAKRKPRKRTLNRPMSVSRPLCQTASRPAPPWTTRAKTLTSLTRKFAPRSYKCSRPARGAAII